MDLFDGRACGGVANDIVTANGVPVFAQTLNAFAHLWLVLLRLVSIIAVSRTLFQPKGALDAHSSYHVAGR